MAQAGFDYLRKFELADPGLLVRRCMGADKFRSLVESRALYFPPARAFKDRLEGYYLFRDFVRRDQELKRHGFGWTARRHAWVANGRIARENQRAVLISCWTERESLNRAIWRKYAGRKDAVTIETTVGELRRQLGQGFLIVRVNYGAAIPQGHSLMPYFHKRPRWEWEREVRIIGEMEPGQRIGTGRDVKLDVGSLVQRIVVSPYASRRYIDAVGHLLAANGIAVPLTAFRANVVARGSSSPQRANQPSIVRKR
jgi:hypothetical protein